VVKTVRFERSFFGGNSRIKLSRLNTMANTLYDRDLQLWIDQTIQQLKNREFGSLAVGHELRKFIA
jgi:hypothetical protein